LAQYATPEGSARYAARFEGRVADGHFRQAQGLWVSSIGLGTYLGEPDEATDAAYRDAVKQAVSLGCNVIDTAINYRFQRSERAIGQALRELFEGPHPPTPLSHSVGEGDEGEGRSPLSQSFGRGDGGEGPFARDELIIATKGGYVPFDGDYPTDPRRYVVETFIRPGIAHPEDFASGHCMAPAYLRHQLEQSRRNLGLDCIDIYYVHNPEGQLGSIPRAEFRQRLRAAFEALEAAVADGLIRMYGTATWNGYRTSDRAPDYLSLADVVELAREAGGENHHFKVIQLPYNLAMTEALTRPNQVMDELAVPVLEAASQLGVTIVTSAPLLESRLTEGLPAAIAAAFPGLATDAQRALQFARSTPGISIALVGMSRAAHVEENLALATVPPATEDQLFELFQRPS
jgi:aryl-alcohol dehydrogenase-like predicted oxidoreductase